MIYTVQLDGYDTSKVLQPVKVGTQDLTVRFKWDMETQAEFDMYENQVKAYGTERPLVSKSDRVNAVKQDWRLTCSKWKEWLDTEPTDFDNTLLVEQRYIDATLEDLIDHLDFCVTDLAALELREADLRERMYWQCSFELEGEIRTGALMLGGWLFPQDLQYQVRFRSDRDSIGYGDLGYVTMEIQVPE